MGWTVSCRQQSKQWPETQRLWAAEPEETFAYGMGLLESSNVTAGCCDILAPASWRTVLKKKPNVFK